jgi:hypothetical protein
MHWYIPNVDPWVNYFFLQVMTWIGNNAVTILVIGNILQLLQAMAIKSPNTTDDKIITMLIYFFSFKWIDKLKNPKPAQPKVP